MTQTLKTIGIAVLLASGILSVACGGSNGNPENPAGPSNVASTFSSVSAAGQPSDLDWATLGSQLAEGALIGLRQALSSGVSTATRSGQWRAADLLNIPLSNLSFSAAYYCCGSVGTGSFMSTSGQVRVVADDAGIIRVVEVGTTYNSVHGTSWNGRSKWSIDLDTDGLRITSTLGTSNGKINERQEFRLVGRLTWYADRGEAKTENINISLGYRDFQIAGATATGEMGPLRLTGQTLPTPNVVRCSRPREGCPPCTPFSPCGPQSCVGFPACGV